MSFPNTFASDGSLYILKNNFATTLNGGLSAGQLAATLASSADLPQVGYITVEYEAIKYTTNNTATGVLSGLTRGAGSTTATSHSDGKEVYGNYVADHHNAMKDEIILIEQNIVQKLGSGTGTIVVPASITAVTINAVSMTVNSPITFNSTATFNGTVVGISGMDYSVTSTFYGPVIFNSYTAFNGTMTVNTTSVHNGPVTFNTTAAFATSPTFPPGTTTSAAVHGADTDTGMNFPSAGAVQIVSSGTSAFEMSAKGEITKPKQPSFRAGWDASTGGTNVTGDYTFYTHPYNVETYDIGGNYNPATYTFTAPVTGKYHFSISLQIQGMGTSTRSKYCILKTSNRDYGTYFSDPFASAGYSVSHTCDMDAGDTAYGQVAVGPGSKDVSLGGGDPYSNFTGMLIG